jgi:hypothetical protein
VNKSGDRSGLYVDLGIAKRLKEENSLLIEALEDMTKMYGRERGLLEINSLHPEYSRAKELLNNLKK